MPCKDKSVLVTGGCGFIGSHLCERLIEEGAKEVIAFDNLVSGRPENVEHLTRKPNFKVVHGDVCDYHTVKPWVAQSDYVFNLAASKMVVSLQRPRTDLETNIIGTFNVLESARGSKVRIVHGSTGSVLGSSENPMPEDFPPNPTSLYGISKLAAERYCLFYAREFGVKVSVIRYFHVYGPRQPYDGEAGVVSIFIARVLQGKPPIIFGDGNQIRCFTFVTDCVNATLLLANRENTVGEVYNVASHTRISVRELADMIIKNYAKTHIQPQHAPPRVGENPRPIPNTHKIEKLGFMTKMSFEEGIKKTREWIENELRKRP